MLKKNDIPGCLEILEKIIAANPNDSEILKKIADIFSVIFYKYLNWSEK